MTVTTIRSSVERQSGRLFAPIRSPLLLLAFAFAFVFVMLGPLISYKPRPFSGDGNPLRQLGYIAVMLVTLVAIRPLLRPERLFVLPLTMVLALGWCWLSVSWAIQPDIAIRRLMLTTIFAWTMFALVANLERTQALSALRWLLIVMLIVNFAVVLTMPTFGIHQSGEDIETTVAGAWRGLMTQKNFAGALCSLTILCFVFDAQRVKILVRLAVIVGAAIFLFFSQSKTSGGILVFSLIAGFLFLRYNPVYRGFLIPLIVVAVCTLFVLAQVYWDAIIAPLSDPSAFTGRTQIWPPLLAYAQEHPLTGSGYGSFWNIGYGLSPIFHYSKGWVLDYVVQAHNGYLDLLVATGVPGLVLIVIATLIVPMARLLASQRMNRQRGALLMSMLLFCAGHNLTESSIFDRDAIVQAFLMFTVAMITVEAGTGFGIGIGSSRARTVETRVE